MQMQSAYWLEKVLKMISLYVSALLCTLQHITKKGQNFQKSYLMEVVYLRYILVVLAA